MRLYLFLRFLRKKDTSYKKIQAIKKIQAMLLLFLPFNASQACREFGAVFFMMRYTLATLSVSRTSFFRARAINIIMRTGHNKILFFHQRFALCLIHNAVAHKLHIREVTADILNYVSIIIRAIILISIVIGLYRHTILVFKDCI